MGLTLHIVLPTMSMFAPDHGPVDHSGAGSARRHHSRGFTASYGWASGNPHHVPRFRMSNYQRPCPRVDQKYGDHAVVRAPYASEGTVNDAPVHNDIPNMVPQFHMSCCERPATTREAPEPLPTWVPPADEKPPAPIHTHRRPNCAPAQEWMVKKDRALCERRNTARPGSIISARNNSSNVGGLMNSFVDPRGDFKPGTFNDARPGSAPADFQPEGKDSAHVPHAAPPQGWAAGYDSSLSRRRNHDSELSSITPRQTTGAQGHLRSNKKMVDAPPSPTRGGQEYSAGQQSKSHSSPMGRQPWASSWDSSLCRKWEGDIAPGRKYTSNVAALIHGGD